MEEVGNQELQQGMSSEEKRNMSMWEDLVLQTGAASGRVGDFPAVEDKPRMLAIQGMNESQQEDTMSALFGEESLDVTADSQVDADSQWHEGVAPLTSLSPSLSPKTDEQMPNAHTAMLPNENVHGDTPKLPDAEAPGADVVESGRSPDEVEVAHEPADDDGQVVEPLAKRTKTTFASKPPPKDEILLCMWQAIVAAFDDLIKPHLVYPAKSEPSFYKFCRESWGNTEHMKKQDFMREARVMTQDWLEVNKDLPMKKP